MHDCHATDSSGTLSGVKSTTVGDIQASGTEESGHYNWIIWPQQWIDDCMCSCGANRRRYQVECKWDREVTV